MPSTSPTWCSSASTTRQSPKAERRPPRSRQQRRSSSVGAAFRPPSGLKPAATQVQSPPMSGVSIAEIVTLVNGRYNGPADRVIRGVATLKDATEDHLSFL